MPRRTMVAVGVMMALLLGTGVVLASHQFSDVPTNHTFHNDIDWLFDNDITAGCSATRFCPEDDVTRGQMAAFLHRFADEFGGARGPAGPPGEQGPPGPAASTEYGVASIEVTKGDGLPLPHAAYSIALGSPVADTTGGVFRMTCDADEAPCTIAVKAAALSDTDIGGTVGFLPRVLVMRGGDIVTEAPDETCEYADGAGGPAGLVNLTKQALAAVPDYEDIMIDIGGSADCTLGAPGPGGVVASISVPEGFYNVHASFAFFTPGD
jgi:S-layer homology domain